MSDLVSSVTRPILGAVFLEFDSQGDLYVADDFAEVVWKVRPDGTTTRLASVPGAWGVAMCRDRFVPPCPRAEPTCDIRGPLAVTCPGDLTDPGLPLDGSASRAADDGPLTFTWTTDCPAGRFDDAHAQQPRLVVPDAGCDLACQVRLEVASTFGVTSSCSASLAVSDTTAPVLASCPADASAPCDAVPALVLLSSTDACDPAPTVTAAELRTGGTCQDSYTLTRTWTARDRCGNASSCSQTIIVEDTTSPTLAGMPADVTVECDAVPPPSSPTASDNCDPSPSITFDELRIEGRCPGDYTLRRTWTATDRCLNSSSRTQAVTVVDTTPPVITPGSGGSACLWPPNHAYRCFTASDFTPAITESCSLPITWRFVGCASNQPDDARGDDEASRRNGDGHTSCDCTVDPDGQGFCVRSERDGAGPDAQDGRTYSVTVTATDACGNTSSPVIIGTVGVPHDHDVHANACLRPGGSRRSDAPCGSP